MNAFRRARKLVLIALVATMGLAPRLLLACAVCYGAPGAAQTRGMNFGIFTMLGFFVSRGGRAVTAQN